MEEHTNALTDLTAAISALTTKIDEIHLVVLELQGWKPSIERSVEELRAEVGDLRTHLAQATPEKAPAAPAAETARNGAPPIRLADLPPLLPLTAATPRQAAGELLPARGDDGHGHTGHGIATFHRGKSPGDHAQRPPPVTGAFDSYHPGESSFVGDNHFSRLPFPPRFDFPSFDSSHPRPWRLKCEAYFRVCTLSPDTWVSCAAMYFIDGTLSWLQSSQAHLVYTVWEDFASAVCVQFGREEFQNLLR